MDPTFDRAADAQDEWTAVGGCQGLYLVPGRQVAAYYRAHAACAAAGAAIVLVLLALRAFPS